VRIALRLSRTVVPNVLARPDFWLFVGIHLTTFGLHRKGLLQADEWYQLDWPSVKNITALTIFFEVFYTNECFKRYTKFFTLIRNMLGVLYDFTFSMRLYTRCSGKPYDRMASRWMVVSQLLFLAEARGNPEAVPRCWNKLLAFGLVREYEVHFLSSLDSQQRLLVMLHATGNLVRAGMVDSNMPVNVTRDVARKLQEYRALRQEAEGLMTFPVPFQYFHLLSLMIMVNISIWAFGMGLSDSVFAPVLFFFSSLIFIGMMDLASQLSNPFGDDEVDFPLHCWTARFLRNIAALLDYEHDGASNDFKEDLEEEVRRKPRLHLDITEVESLLYDTAMESPEAQRKTTAFGDVECQGKTPGSVRSGRASGQSTPSVIPTPRGSLLEHFSRPPHVSPRLQSSNAMSDGMPRLLQYTPLHLEVSTK